MCFARKTKMEEGQNIQSFGTVDFVVFGGSLLIAVLIGIYYAIKDRKNNNTDAYYFGERRMSPIPLGLSISVSFISAILIIGFPTETYLFGLIFIWFAVSTIIPLIIACWLYIPLVHRLNLSTINQYLELRFHHSTRKLATVISCVEMIFYMSMTIYIPGLALSAVTPFSLKTTVVMTSVICTLYTTLGGMKAVVWTDTLQSVVMLCGLIAVLIKTTMLVGGFGNVWDALERGGRINVINFSPDPTIRNTFWTIMVGNAINGIYPRQAIIQRYQSCDSINQARKPAVSSTRNTFYYSEGVFVDNAFYERAAAVALFPQIIFVVLAVFSGAAMYTYYENCDPLLSHKVEKPDQRMPYLVVEIFQDLPGLAGLYVAAAFSGTLSTVSSGINSLAVLLMEDFIMPQKPNISQALKIGISKGIVVLFGAVVMGIALAVEHLDGTIARIVSTFTGAIGGPLLGLFLLGLLFPWANAKGALLGQVIATGISLWIGLCSFLYRKSSAIVNQELPLSIDGCPMSFDTTQSMVTTETFQPTTFASTNISESNGIETTLYAISHLYYSPLSMLLTVIVGLIASFITGANKPADADPELFVPIISHKVFPAKVRKFFRLGVPNGIPKNVS